MQSGYDNLIKPVKNRRTFEEVSDRLKELIFNGTLEPGQQLPSENELAQLFQVGRQSVREALRVLEISGFISTKPGIKGGAVIEGTVLSKLSNLFLETFKFHRASLKDCLATRRVMELSIIELVVKNADKYDVENLRKTVERAEAKLAVGIPAFVENLDFHRFLVKASKNYVFVIVMELLLAVYADFRIKAGTPLLQQSKAMIDCHVALIDAIIKRKKKESLEILEKDMALGGEILMGPRLSVKPLSISSSTASVLTENRSLNKQKR